MPTRLGPDSGGTRHARKAGFGLDQKVVGLAFVVGRSRGIAADVADDQARMGGAQLRASDAEPAGSARGKVLDEHVGLRQHRAHEVQVLGLFQIDPTGFLPAIVPHVVAGLAEHVIVVAAGEIPLRAFELDDAGAGVRELRRRERGGDGLLQGNDDRALQRAFHGSVPLFVSTVRTDARCPPSQI